MRYPRTKRIWKGMLDRCKNPQSTGYVNYGGRGITCCARWEDFETFLSDMGPAPEGLSLDRIDPDGHYEPGNCRWATPQDQARNTRVQHKIRAVLDSQPKPPKGAGLYANLSYIQFPKDLIFSGQAAEMGSAAFGFLVVAQSYAAFHDGRTLPPISTIAQPMGLSVRRCWGILNRLIELGHITRQSCGECSYYQLTVPAVGVRCIVSAGKGSRDD